MVKEYFYKLECETDPTNKFWRASVQNYEYRFVKNEGIYTRYPITDMRQMFEGTLLTDLDASDWDLSSVTDMVGMFEGATSLTSVSLPDTSSVTDMSFMFKGATSLTSVSLPDTSSATTMLGMFRGATSLTNVSLPNTGSVTDMLGMFRDATRLTNVSLPNTGSVTDMRWMFHGATSLTNVSIADTSNVTTMYGMFRRATSFAQDIRNWNVDNVGDFNAMFKGATAMISKFNTSANWNVTPTAAWFDTTAPTLSSVTIAPKNETAAERIKHLTKLDLINETKQ